MRLEYYDLFSNKKWMYDEKLIHIKDFDKYKKYSKFFVVQYKMKVLIDQYYLFFGKGDVYVFLNYDDIEKILAEKFKTEIINDIRKEKIKQLENGIIYT